MLNKKENMFNLKTSLVIFGAALIAMPVHAQSEKPFDMAHPSPTASSTYSEQELEKMVPPARPEDVSSPEAIVRAMHESLSGPKGEWNPDRFRSLFIPNAFIGYDDAGKDGTPLVATLTLDDLIKELQQLHRQTAWYETVVDVPTIIKIRRNKQTTLVTLSATAMEATQQPIPEDTEKGTSFTSMIYIGRRWWIVSHFY